jgi:hypothetical protein
MPIGPGTVVGVIVTVAEADLVVSAAEVAVTVALVGRPAAIVGAVYKPVESIDPPFGVVTAQVTAILLVFVTVEVNCAVCGGQLSAESFANTVAPTGLTLTPTAGWLLLPQAIRNPISTNETHRPAIAECFDILRPNKPTITTPAIGKVNGSHGERLSARL